jgi:hypothetical protein
MLITGTAVPRVYRFFIRESINNFTSATVSRLFTYQQLEPTPNASHQRKDIRSLDNKRSFEGTRNETQSTFPRS